MLGDYAESEADAYFEGIQVAESEDREMESWPKKRG